MGVEVRGWANLFWRGILLMLIPVAVCLAVLTVVALCSAVFSFGLAVAAAGLLSCVEYVKRKAGS